MKKFLVTLCFCLPGIFLLAQKTYNDPNVEKRTTGSFHGIEVGTGVELMLSEGSTEEIAVSASKPEFRDKLVTEVKNGILKIHYESQVGAINRTRENKNLKAYVSYKTLDILNANTGAEVKINGILKSASLDMEVNTGALVNGEVNVTTLKLKQNTGSKVTLTGKADKLEVEGDTGSKFKGDDLSTSSCLAKVSTGAQVSVRAEKELEAKANTGGNVRYKGNATQVDIKTNTGGSVSKI